ncbi:MAG: choice-of-anchor B family protein [Hymenobacteraceae bacterium]|nr:choice-of-anchor B family protein [Hymenobacteraceae bacterium]MDX5397008.1 choice-of-anchor B family protein [Hymenobacteraceae bacterium]MDX5443909.1 choice-of-anchor B family protein [Hymenobacteraceae bacterium]MDX5513082.1 choice-of-anchor B family protein [Hymenobacteraceae bacterium]
MLKKLLYLWLFYLLIIPSFAQEQLTASNMKLLSNWQLPEVGVYYNDIWGYSANGREYAIIGSNAKTNFVDVTNPTDPVLIASFFGNDSNVVWRDFKTYGHYAYGVADGGKNSLQIFDLQYLPDKVVKVYDSDFPTRSAHNCFIDNGKLYLISNRSNQHGFVAADVYSLVEPTLPRYLGTFRSTFYNDFHDVYVKNDTAYCSAAYKGMVMFNIKDINNPVLLGSISSYPYQGYNHSSWTTSDSKILVMADEVPQGLPLKIYDISDFSQPKFLSTFQSTPGGPGVTGSTPHNPFIYGDHVIVSYYHDGVQVYNISDPKNPVRVGYYDTYPDNSDFSGFRGCWGVYPYLPSGNIIASDITHGLFVLTPPYELLPTNQPQTASVYPNPANGVFRVKTSSPVTAKELMLYNLTGQKIPATFYPVAPNTFELAVPVAQGLYVLRVEGGTEATAVKVLVQ